MSGAGKVVKNCSLPMGVGATLGMGAASLIGYKMVQNNFQQIKQKYPNLKIG